MTQPNKLTVDETGYRAACMVYGYLSASMSVDPKAMEQALIAYEKYKSNKEELHE